MNLYKEAFDAFAKINTYTVYFHDKPIVTFYTKQEAIAMKRSLISTALYWYGEASDVETEDQVKIKKEIKFIETEIDFAHIQKKVKGKIEVL
jgi:hypothetical protein